MPHHLLIHAQGRCRPDHDGGRSHPIQQVVGPSQPPRQAAVILAGAGTGPLLAHDRDPVLEPREPGHVDAETEAVEQLGSELALVGVHGPDQEEARRVGDGDLLARDHVDAHGGGVQEHVDQVVLEQVHLVHVEELAVGLGQNSRLEGPTTLAQRSLQVDRTDHPILGGTEGQLHHPGGPDRNRQSLPQGQPGSASLALLSTPGRAAVGAVQHPFLPGQDPGQRPHQGRLGGPPLAPDQDAAQLGVDHGQKQGQLHPLLANHPGE